MAAARSSRATTFSSGTDAGRRRSRGYGRVEEDCGREPPRDLSVRLFFRDERATPALLAFLVDTRVGRVPGLALMGVAEDESELGEIDLWPQTEEEGWSGKSEEEGGPGPP